MTAIDLLQIAGGWLAGVVTREIFKISIETKIRKILNRLKISIGRLYLRFVSPSSRGSLTISGHDLTIDVIDGDGLIEYHRDSMRIVLKERPKLPADIADRVDLVRKREEEKKASGCEPFWNGPQAGLLGYTIGRTLMEDQLTISATMYPTDYFHYQASCAALIADRAAGNASEMFARYIAGQASLERPISFLATGVGVVMAIVTADGKLVTSKRSDSSGVRRGHLDLAIAESINPLIDVSDPPIGREVDIWKCAARGVLEEVGVDPLPDNIHMLGFAGDSECQQYNFLGVVFLEETEEDLLSARARGIRGKWELSSLKFVKFECAELVPAIEESSKWGFDLLAVYWAALFRGTSIREVQRMFLS